MINKDRPRYFRKQSADERIQEYFFNLRRENPRIFVLYLVLGCMFLGMVLTIPGAINTTRFWKFINNVEPSEIEQIEVQKIDKNGIGISGLVTITDRVSIANFASASKTVQKHSTRPYNVENEAKVTIWLKNQKTIELRCFTTSGFGETVFVQYVSLKPGIFTFGEGNAHFPESEFYNWLLNTGVGFE